MKDLISRLNEEIQILKKQLEQNPNLSERNAKVVELTIKLNQTPKASGLIKKLDQVLDLQTGISCHLERIMAKVETQKPYSLSKKTKSHQVDIADMKLIYEEKLEQKMERIKALESKNQQYLDIIAESEKSKILDESTCPEEFQIYDHMRSLTKKGDNLQISET